jgi:sugar porter (SP) family MFS transporter
MIFSIFQLITLPFCPESPRYLLINRNRSDETEEILQELRGSTDVKHEMDDMKMEAEMEANLEKFTIKQLFTSRSLLVPIILSIVLHLSQQLSGINAVFYYSTDILKKAGFGESAVYATPFIGIIMLVMTIVSIPLMEKAGRRILHLLGLGGMLVASIFITIGFVLQDEHDQLKFLTIVAMFFFVVFFAIGPGSIPWMIVGELFTQGPRPAAISVAVFVNWMANFAVGLAFPPLFDVNFYFKSIYYFLFLIKTFSIECY